MVKKSKISLLSLVMAFSFNTFAQSFSTSDVLKTYVNDATTKANIEYENGINELKFKIPLVEEINFRTETDQFNLERQEYAVRTMFNGFKESKYYSVEKMNLIALKLLEKKKSEKASLYRKYQDLITLKYNQEIISIFDTLEVVYAQKLKLLIHTIATGEFVQPKDILKIEEVRYELGQKRKSAIVAIENSRNKLKLESKTNKLSTEDWISISTIEKLIQDLKYVLPETELEKYNISNARNQSNYMMEKANNNRILDYAQLRYSKRDNLLFQDEFSIGFGLRLPYRGSNIKAKNDFLIKNQEINYQKTTKTITDAEDFERDLTTIKSLLQEYKFYELSVEKIFKTLNENHLATSYEISLAKNMINLTNQEKQMQIGEKIYNLYINLLSDADKISQQPLKNYLSEDLKNF